MIYRATINNRKRNETSKTKRFGVTNFRTDRKTEVEFTYHRRVTRGFMRLTTKFASWSITSVERVFFSENCARFVCFSLLHRIVTPRHKRQKQPAQEDGRFLFDQIGQFSVNRLKFKLDQFRLNCVKRVRRFTLVVIGRRRCCCCCFVSCLFVSFVDSNSIVVSEQHIKLNDEDLIEWNWQGIE